MRELGPVDVLAGRLTEVDAALPTGELRLKIVPSLADWLGSFDVTLTATSAGMVPGKLTAEVDFEPEVVTEDGDEDEDVRPSWSCWFVALASGTYELKIEGGPFTTSETFVIMGNQRVHRQVQMKPKPGRISADADD